MQVPGEHVPGPPGGFNQGWLSGNVKSICSEHDTYDVLLQARTTPLPCSNHVASLASLGSQHLRKLCKVQESHLPFYCHAIDSELHVTTSQAVLRMGSTAVWRTLSK